MYSIIISVNVLYTFIYMVASTPHNIIMISVYVLYVPSYTFTFSTINLYVDFRTFDYPLPIFEYVSVT